MSETKIYEEIKAERERQRAKWGGDAADDKHNDPLTWIAYLTHYSTSWMRGATKPYPRFVLERFRTSMVKVAALGVAAAGWADRVIANQNKRPDVMANDHLLLQNVERSVTSANFKTDESLSDFMIAINRALLDRGLFADSTLYMGGPIAKINGKDVEAGTRRLAVIVELQSTNGPPIPSQNVFNHIVDDIEAEFVEEIERLAAEGKVMCPYVPVISSGVVIDPSSFQPKITFMTRYGVTEQRKTGDKIYV